MNLCREKTGREDASQHATTKKCLSGTPRAGKTAGQQREDPRRLECHFALFRNRPQEDGSLTVQTEMEPLGELTISTHGRVAKQLYCSCKSLILAPRVTVQVVSGKASGPTSKAP